MTDEVIETSEEVAVPTPDHDTAFIVVKTHSGDYIATADLASVFTVARVANRQDIKRACNELAEKLREVVIAAAVVSQIIQKDTEVSQPTASAIRQALSNRDLI